LFEVLKRRLGEDDNHKRIKYDGITLKDVNEILDQLTISGDDRRDLFLKLTAKMTANEQKWLTRIVLKCLRIGIPDGQVMKLIHPDAPAIFDVRMNLSEVVKIFAANPNGGDDYEREKHLQVILFSPFKPMLAEREQLEKSVEILSGPFYIEPKLDGERCQLHYNKNTGIFRYFSRQGTEYTYLYGRSASEGSLSPKIIEEKAFNSEVDSIVLDGEMVVYDPLIDKFLPFGTLKTSAGTRYDPGRSGDEPHPCLVIFDLVYWNGQSLLNWTLEERSDLLKKLVKPVKGFFELIDRSALKQSTSDITEALEEAVQDQGEGLILKDPQSRYIVAHRSSHWIKIKPEYVEGMCDDLDVVVIGAWHGRAGNIKASYGKANEFLCGIWSEDRR
jgi:DNA ligase 4